MAILVCALALAGLAAGAAATAAQSAPSQEPPPDETEPRKLDPFPVVVIAGRQGKRTTSVTELTVRGPRHARVRVRCLGRICPVRRVGARIPAGGRLRLRRAQRIYRAGTGLEIKVTAEDRIGKYTKVRFRRGRTPSRRDSCLRPGEREPSPCPAG
jgi:hypothetical protein